MRLFKSSFKMMRSSSRVRQNIKSTLSISSLFLLCCALLLGITFYSSRKTFSSDDGSQSDKFLSSATKNYNLMTESVLRNWRDKVTAGEVECTIGIIIPYFLILNDCIKFALKISFENVDYMNTNKLEQDHPCVIEIIRRQFLAPPAPSNVPYSFSNVTECDSGWNVTTIFDPNGDPSMGQTAKILTLLKNMVIKLHWLIL